MMEIQYILRVLSTRKPTVSSKAVCFQLVISVFVLFQFAAVGLRFLFKIFLIDISSTNNTFKLIFDFEAINVV